MASPPPEPPTVHSISAAANRRSYSCYNCNHAFYITPTAANDTSAPSPHPSSFRCPRCFQRHLIPHHTVSPPPPPPPPPPPGTNSDSTPGQGGIFTYYTSDDFESDIDDYDSDNSLLSFSFPNYHISASALTSFLGSLPIKKIDPNSTEPRQSCTICMEDFTDVCGIVVELPCKHCFDRDCIGEWIKRSNTCPMCRFKLPLDRFVDKLELAESRAVAEYNEVLEFHLDRIGVVELPPMREPILRRVNAEFSLSAIAEAEALGSDWRVLSTNGGERSRWFEAMHDEDGDTLMVDA